jgi:hypothetical protein
MRLLTTARTRKPPRPPLGLLGWTPDAPAAAILLDAAALIGDELTAIARQLPPATTMAAGAPIVVFGVAAGGGGFWGRMLGSGLHVSRATRCGALVARGYVDVGAGLDNVTKMDIAWGRTPDA